MSTENVGMVVGQWRRSWRAAFREAEALLREHEPKDLVDDEQKDRYWSCLPMIAMQMVNELRSASGFIEQAPPAVVTQHFEHMDAILSKIDGKKQET